MPQDKHMKVWMKLYLDMCILYGSYSEAVQNFGLFQQVCIKLKLTDEQKSVVIYNTKYMYILYMYLLYFSFNENLYFTWKFIDIARLM